MRWPQRVEHRLREVLEFLSLLGSHRPINDVFTRVTQFDDLGGDRAHEVEKSSAVTWKMGICGRSYIKKEN